MPDDGAAEVRVTNHGSLAAIALTGLARLLPPGPAQTPELQWLQAQAAETEATAGALEQALAQPLPRERRLAALVNVLRLRPLEALAAALALEVEVNALAAHALARLQGSQGGSGPMRPSLGVLARLGAALALDGMCSDREHIGSLLCGAALASGALREIRDDAPAVERCIALPEALVSALLGADGEPLARPGFAPLNVEASRADPLPLPASWQVAIARQAARLAAGPREHLVLRGASHREMRSVAGRIAHALGRQAVVIHGAAATARLLRDGVSARGEVSNRHYPGGLEPWLIATCALPVVVAEPAPGETLRVPRFEFYRGPVIVIAGSDGEVELGCGDEVVSFTWRLPLPSVRERAALWQEVLSAAPAACRVDDTTIDTLASAFRTGVAPLIQLAKRVMSTVECATDGSLLERAAAAALDAGAAEQQHAFSGLAQRVAAAVPESALVATGALARELDLLLARCRAREYLTANLGLGSQTRYSPGIKVLFAGASGTGKTLAALWIAQRLSKPIYRVDLAAVSSKYIGETEKNLAQLLSSAEHADCVLLFDEADSLFGNRTEVRQANDRFANTQTNYLLQRIEAFEGIAILTSNSKERLDDSFTRRLDGVIEFPLPGGAERRALWTLHLGESHGLTAVELNLLAAEADLAGGHIRNAVLTAALLSRPRGGAPRIGLVDCVHALTMEYAKLGRRLPDGLQATVPSTERVT